MSYLSVIDFGRSLAEHVYKILDDVLDLNGNALTFEAACKGQHLFYEVRPAFGVFTDHR